MLEQKHEHALISGHAYHVLTNEADVLIDEWQ
ncbi:hypothetical protein [Salicibibacter kimchii]